MYTKTYRQIVIFLLAPLVLAGFYIFSRFTVDDAFITWRYGRNLVEYGVWGYNPSQFDLTQAYTNPLMAALSLIPAFIHGDTVLFFKLVAIISIILPLVFLLKTAGDKWKMAALYLAFLALPATMIHAFSGLETFWFAILTGLLLLALLREHVAAANLLALLLVFVRPEAWLLIALVPAYIAYISLRGVAGYGIFPLRRANIGKLKKPLLSFALLGGFFALYAAFHRLHFGYILPNTFYIKSGNGFTVAVALKLLFFLSPAFLLGNRYKPLLAFIIAFFTPIIYNYATSDLQMDYMERFSYHVFAPVYILLAYLATVPPPEYPRRRLRQITTCAAALFLLAFAARTSYPPSLLGIANYYPRILNSHAALGREISRLHAKYGITGFALSDAGIAAYHSGIIAFDNTGLGSALVAHQGAEPIIIEQYNPHIVVLRADADGVVLSNQGKKNLLQWAQTKSYHALCDIVWKPDYKLRIFAATDIPEFMSLCRRSKAINNVTEWDYWVAQTRLPPWHFWHE